MRAAPKFLLPSLAALLGLSGCALGPDYQKPATATPVAFAEPSPWKVATPRDHLPRDAWWTIYRDAELDRLQARTAEANPTLAAALARRDQARALTRAGRAGLYPAASVNASAERTRTAPDSRTGAAAYTDNTFSLPLDLSYELDFWGRVRRAAEASDALAAASEADYHNALLGIQADVARLYFTLRALDAEHALLERTVATRRESLDIADRRLELGAGADLDVQLARAELATAEGELLAVEQDRAASRHALAILTGRLPSEFVLAPSAQPLPDSPAIPLALPSELLERRPDIASSERTLAAANAGIGAAKAAFFPAVTLTASAGYESSALDTLTRWDNRQWSFGPGITLPVFQGGRNTANYRRAQALHAEALSAYRGAVLDAFREVETALSDLRLLAARQSAQATASEASRAAADLVRVRYESGRLGYLDVADAERVALANERLLVRLRGQNLLAGVSLVRALGGGW
ncbi:MAG: efflux transporter outer membrane subunit [Verrucomicrobiota bacterium]